MEIESEKSVFSLLKKYVLLWSRWGGFLCFYFSSEKLGNNSYYETDYIFFYYLSIALQLLNLYAPLSII